VDPQQQRNNNRGVMHECAGPFAPPAVKKRNAP